MKSNHDKGRVARAASKRSPDPGMIGRRVLVTGASGFLGVALCERLLAAGAEVHAVSRRQQNSEAIRWWQTDLAEFDATRRLISDVSPHVVYHLSGAITGAPALEYVQDTFSSVLASTVNLLQSVTEQRIGRMIFVGSSEEPKGPADRIVPSSPYGAAKYASSMYARMFHALYNTPTVTLRLCMTYGPRQPEHRMISYTIRSFLRGETPKLASGRRRMDLVYLDDVIDAFLRAAVLPKIEGRCADLGSGRAVSVRKVVQTIKRLTGTSVQPVWGVVADRPGERTVRIADLKSAKSVLGWKPTTALADGLSRMIEWYRSQLLEEVRNQ